MPGENHFIVYIRLKNKANKNQTRQSHLNETDGLFITMLLFLKLY